MTNTLIYGAGGLGLLVLDILRQAGQHQIHGFLDSDPQTHGLQVNGVTVGGGLDQIDRCLEAGVSHAIVAIGDNRERAAVADQLRERGLQLTSAIHPLASLAPSARIGEHVVIGPRSTICVHATIGAHTVISAGSIVEHDNIIESAVFLHPAVRLAGAVHIETQATLGIGASVIPGCRIGRAARVAPGSVVIRDVPAGLVVSGIPARQNTDGTARFVAHPPLRPPLAPTSRAEIPS